MPRRSRWRPLSRREQPSPVQYERLAIRYVEIVRQRIRRAFRAAFSSRRRVDAAEEWPDVPLTPEDIRDAVSSLAIQLSLQGQIPRPSPGDVARVGHPIAMKATSGQRLQLTRAGMGPHLLASRLGIDGDELIGIALRLAPGEQQLLDVWASEGADLITATTRGLVEQLPTMVEEHAAAGASWRTLAQHVEDRISVTRSHARLIARDQTAKLNGRITEHLQRKGGVTHYTWRSSHDGRVRETHAAVDGQVYAWAGPGAPGAGPYGQSAHPGQGINCRCTAEPVIPD